MIRRKILLFCLGTLILNVMSAQKISYYPTKHYRDRVEQFDKQDDLDSTKIVMLGNSLTENAEFYGDWKNLLHDDMVVNRGISGDDANGIINRLVQILPKKPKAIILMCGTNDLSHKLNSEQVFIRCKRLIDTIRTTVPNTKLYIQSLLPINESFGRWKSLSGCTDTIPIINGKLHDYCEEKGITFINLFPYFAGHLDQTKNMLLPNLSVDGLHLSLRGYEVWARELKPYIEELNFKNDSLNINETNH